MNVYQSVLSAQQRINPYIRQTPLEYSHYLSERCNCKVYLKLENQQVTGSFKSRGATNKIVGLSKEEKKKGVITASTGNHAAAVGHALNIAGISGIIYMPKTVAELKIQNLKQYSNVSIVLFGKDSVETEREAIRQSFLQEMTYISPYNDEEIIGGQGTIGYEILEELPETDAVFVPVGGGGLISGIGGYCKEVKPNIDIIGCQPINSAVMYHSSIAGRVLDMDSTPTVSDGTAGGIEENSITFPLCQEFVTDYHLVEENEILEALSILLQYHQIMAEGAAGLSVASLIKNKTSYRNKTVALIICGNKMSIELLTRVIGSQ